MALICKNWLTLRLGLGLAFRHRKDKGQIFTDMGQLQVRADVSDDNNVNAVLQSTGDSPAQRPTHET